MRLCSLTKSSLFAVLGMLILISCSSETPTTINKTDTLIQNINGYSMTDSGLSTFSALLIRDGKIVSVGNADKFDLDAVATTIDGGGNTVLPGLIDAEFQSSPRLTRTYHGLKAKGGIRCFGQAKPSQPRKIWIRWISTDPSGWSA